MAINNAKRLKGAESANVLVFGPLDSSYAIPPFVLTFYGHEKNAPILVGAQ
jgi:hypothetical protein